MLTGLKDGDSGTGGSIPASQTLPRGFSLVFAVGPTVGAFTLGESNHQTPQVSYGLNRLYIPYALR